uniref:Uncharacterized protein n=1 Tax=Aegilops tauschii subsp. strangulata TaxID=200361 RepID=A0A453LHB2_AEGTS
MPKFILKIINQESGVSMELKLVLWRKVLAVDRQSLIVHGCTLEYLCIVLLVFHNYFLFVFICF